MCINSFLPVTAWLQALLLLNYISVISYLANILCINIFFVPFIFSSYVVTQLEIAKNVFLLLNPLVTQFLLFLAVMSITVKIRKKKNNVLFMYNDMEIIKKIK